MGMEVTVTIRYTPELFKCTCCGKELPETEFARQSYTGLRCGQCKQCTKIKRKVKGQKASIGKFISKERVRGFEEPDYSIDDWKAAMLYFDGKCCYCGTEEGRAKAAKFDREHLVPISKGGKTSRYNIAPSCKSCNRSRGNRDLVEWFRSRPFWTQERENRIIAWMKKGAE